MKSKFTYLLYSLFLLLLLSCSQKKENHLSSEKKISVICPTYNRHNRHANLYAAFKNQTYDNKELLILDDSPSPSPFFSALQDPTVKYIHIPMQMSIGEKRNLLVEMSTGDLIAHFDDDDYYAPAYLVTMEQSLGAADLIKLSKWLIWKELDGSLWEWDTRHFDRIHYVLSGNSTDVPKADTTRHSSSELDTYTEQNIWGFGFSYFYKKSLWNDCRFEHINSNEDYLFITLAKKLNKSLIHMPDDTHMVLHTLHNGNTTAKIFPQHHLESSQATQLLGEMASPWLVVEKPKS